MMRGRLLALAERRASLVARAQSEREMLSGMIAPIDAAASLATSFVRVARGVLDQAARYPLAVIAGMALLVALRPKRTVIWLSRGWSLWRLYLGARGWWLRFAAPATETAGAPPGAPR